MPPTRQFWMPARTAAKGAWAVVAVEGNDGRQWVDCGGLGEAQRTSAIRTHEMTDFEVADGQLTETRLTLLPKCATAALDPKRTVINLMIRQSLGGTPSSGSIRARIFVRPW